MCTGLLLESELAETSGSPKPAEPGLPQGLSGALRHGLSFPPQMLLKLAKGII